MKRIIASLAAIAMMAGAAPAFAGDQNFEGHGTNNPLTGTLNVEQTVALTCNAVFNAYFESDGKRAWLTEADLTGGTLGLCGLITFPGLAHEIEIVDPGAGSSGPATVLRIRNLTVGTLTSSCQGDALADWDGLNKTLKFNNVTIAGVGGAKDCQINGVLSAPTVVKIERL